MAFKYNWKVRVGDTDFSGLVFTPKVIECMVEGIEDLMEEIGCPPSTAHDRGFIYPVAHAEADYISPLGIGDNVKIEMIPNVGNSSVTFNFTGEIEEIVFKGEITTVFIDKETMDSVSIPNEVKDNLEKI